MKIEPGFYKGKDNKGRSVILLVYGKHPFLRVDMVELWGRKDVAMSSMATNVDPVKLGIEFVECIENLNIEEE
jgi:hypothetical protein